MKARAFPLVLAAALASTAPSFGQTTKPADPPGVAARIAEAKTLAGDRYAPVQAHLCYLHSSADDAALAARRAKAPLGPTRVFDNFYYVGLEEVAAWALRTSRGIVLFDTLDNPEEAQSAILDGLRALGLDPKDIKYIVLTHAHGDHFGGASFLKAQTGAPVLMSAEDWDYLASHPGPPAWRRLAPSRDQVIKDGERLDLGDSVVTFHVTPGHTPGTVSSIFTVKDHGQVHTVAFWGGVGIPTRAEDLAGYIASDEKFQAVATAAHADVGITNHPHADMTLEWVSQLRREQGRTNPLVVGPSGVAQWLGVIRACAQAQQERLRAGAAPMGRVPIRAEQ